VRTAQRWSCRHATSAAMPTACTAAPLGLISLHHKERRVAEVSENRLLSGASLAPRVGPRERAVHASDFVYQNHVEFLGTPPPLGLDDIVRFFRIDLDDPRALEHGRDRPLPPGNADCNAGGRFGRCKLNRRTN